MKNECSNCQNLGFKCLSCSDAYESYWTPSDRVDGKDYVEVGDDCEYCEHLDLMESGYPCNQCSSKYTSNFKPNDGKEKMSKVKILDRSQVTEIVKMIHEYFLEKMANIPISQDNDDINVAIIDEEKLNDWLKTDKDLCSRIEEMERDVTRRSNN